MGIKQFVDDFMTVRAMRHLAGKSYSMKDPYLAKIFGSGAEDNLTDPYSQISVVYAAVRAKAVNVAQVPFRVYPKDGDEEITRGPIVNLFNYVNPYSSKYQLWESVVTLLDTTGEAAVLLDPEVVDNIPVALWPFHKNNMTPKKQGGAVIGWEVKVNGTTQFFGNDEVIFNKYYNPHDQVRGLSPLSAAQLSLDAEWGAVNYNQDFFEKGTTVGAVYQTDDSLNDEQFKRLKNELIGARQGSSHMHEALLLDGGVKLSNLRPSNRDMEFLELRKFTREEIAMIYHVPKSELSLYEDIKN